MRFLASVILTAILSFIGGLWLPWWSIAPIAFLVSLAIHLPPLQAFLSGFIGLFIVWGGLAWRIDVQNQGILSKKIAMILPLNGSSFLLITITALIGGLVAGLGALSGSFARSGR